MSAKRLSIHKNDTMANANTEPSAIKTIVMCASVFIISVLVALCLNVLSTFIPHEAIHEHISQSAEIFAKEGVFPELIDGYTITIPDNNTDAWMMLIADYNNDSEDVFEKALAGHFNVYSTEGIGQIGMDNIGFTDSENVLSVGTYSRYWHGWLLTLKLLFVFLDYSGIRIFNLIITILLFTLVMFAIIKKRLFELIIPFAFAFFLMMPITVSKCIAYMISYIITMVLLLILIYNYDYLRHKTGLSCFFMLSGSVVAFSEFLQFPLITLGYPMVFVTFFMIKNGESVKKCIVNVFKYGIVWSVGYLGMWASKWVLATLLTPYNTIQEAISQVSYRSSSHTMDKVPDSFGRLFAVAVNIWQIIKLPVLLIIFILCAYYLVKHIKNKSLNKKTILIFVPYFLIALYPILWWFACANHSFEHNHFTYRLITISFLAVFTAAGQVSSTCDQ